jgi:hypothetical protein
MNVRQITLAALALWFVAVFAVGATGAFTTPPGTPPLPILVGATLPLALFFAAYAGSRRFRELVLSADLRLLTALQAWRAGGLGFIALSTHGVLPGLFAWPAGLGDIAIGVTAPWMALALARDRAFAGTRAYAAWNRLGILDLVVAVSLGTASSGVLPAFAGNVTTAAMAQLPLVLIPAYFVPLFVMLHAVALLQARRAEKAEDYFSAGGLSSAAR